MGPPSMRSGPQEAFQLNRGDAHDSPQPNGSERAISDPARNCAATYPEGVRELGGGQSLTCMRSFQLLLLGRGAPLPEETGQVGQGLRCTATPWSACGR